MSAFPCPSCGGETRVSGHYTSRRKGRPTSADPGRRRYRRCRACGLHITTVEAVIDTDPGQGGERRAALEIGRRYLDLSTPARAAIRNLMNTLEAVQPARPRVPSDQEAACL